MLETIDIQEFYKTNSIDIEFQMKHVNNPNYATGKYVKADLQEHGMTYNDLIKY